MTPTKLRTECLGSDPKNSILHMMYKDGKLAGQAFATKWTAGTGVLILPHIQPKIPNIVVETVGWVTQLVVAASERRKRIATNLLRGLAASPWFSGVTMMGVASTHPAACNALCNMLGKSTYSPSMATTDKANLELQTRISLPSICHTSKRTLRRLSIAHLSSICDRRSCTVRCSRTPPTVPSH